MVNNKKFEKIVYDLPSEKKVLNSTIRKKYPKRKYNVKDYKVSHDLVYLI